MVETLVADVFDPQWVNLSEEYTEKNEKLQKAISDFYNEEKVPPICVVGPYGIGKTELMFESFRFAWKNGIPALYTTLRDILRLLPDQPMDEQELPEKLDEIVSSNIEELRRAFTSGGEELPDNIFLPSAKGKSAEEYFGKLGGFIDKNMHDFESTLENKHCILFVDEMEEGWRGDKTKGIPGLTDIVVAETGRLRKLFEDVELRNLNFYLIMGFGMVSLYEVLGTAEAGRQVTIHLPLLGIDALYKYFTKDQDLSKFLWWASRGRPRWIKRLNDEHLSDLKKLKNKTINFDEFLNTVKRTEIENVPVIDPVQLPDMGIKEINHALRDLIFLNATEINNDALSGLYGKNMVFVASGEDDTASIEDIVFAFSKDLKNLSESKSLEIDDIKIRVYLKRILDATGNDGKIMVAGWDEKAKTFSYGFVAPLILLLHDFMLEFEGEDEGGKKDEYQKYQKNTMELLYELIKDFGIATGSVADTHKFTQNFENSFRYFREVHTPSEWQASLSMVEKIFPRIIVNPNISKENIEETKARLEQHIKDTNNFLEETIPVGGFKVKFIFVLSEGLMDKFTQKYFRSWEEYLQNDTIFYVLFLGGKLENIKHITQHLEEKMSILYERKKLHFGIIDERRLQDFIVSSWNYNGFELATSKDFFEILGGIIEEAGTPKIIKRTIQHYKPRIENILSEKAKKAVEGDERFKGYKKELQKIVPFGDPDFPKNEIKSVLTERREEQTIDWLILCFGVSSDKSGIIDIFSKLREVSDISGYKKFIEDYTAKIRPRGLTDKLETLSSFISRFNEFPHAKEIAESFKGDKISFEDVISARTPLEHFLNPKDDVERSFLKALTLMYLLDENEIGIHFDKVKEDIGGNIEYIQRLSKDVDEFNKKINRDIFSIGELGNYKKSLEEIKEDLEKQFFTKSSKYVITRVLEKIEEKLEIKHQQAKTSFDSVWRELKSVLNDLEEAKIEVERELKRSFESNMKLKESIIGDFDSLKKGIITKLEEIKTNFLDEIGSLPINLDEEKEMSDGIRINIKEVREKLETIGLEVSNIEEQSKQIDKMLNTMGEVKEGLQEIHKIILEGVSL